MLFGVFLTSNTKFFPGNVPVSFFSLMVVYGIAIVAGAWILHKIRERGKSAVPPVPPPVQPITQ